MQYKSTKRFNIKKWFNGGNSKYYAGILIVLIIILAFVLINANNLGIVPDRDDTISQESSISDNTETDSVVLVPENQSYKVRVNKTNNFVTIYKLDNNREYTNVVRTFRCSVNASVPTGSFTIEAKHIWRKLDNNVYGQYTVNIGSGGYLHSVPYRSESNASLITTAYNNLGKEATIGYISLISADAKWIYENCGNSTPVEIYESADEEPAIALEEMETIPFGASFDPSDVQNSKNIAPGKIRYMSGVKDITIPANSDFDRWDGIYAVNEDREDITSYINITGTLDTTTPGSYTLIYNLQDTEGTVLAYYRYITVE